MEQRMVLEEATGNSNLISIKRPLYNWKYPSHPSSKLARDRAKDIPRNLQSLRRIFCSDETYTFQMEQVLLNELHVPNSRKAANVGGGLSVKHDQTH